MWLGVNNCMLLVEAPATYEGSKRADAAHLVAKLLYLWVPCTTRGSHTCKKWEWTTS